MSLQSEIDAALDVPNWDEAISLVKAKVADALNRADPTVTVTDTKYFNHSFVPDFRLEWPDRQRPERDLYLRLDTGNAFLRGDLEYLRSSHPVLLGLTHLEEASGAVQEAMADTDVLLSEPHALEELAGERPEAPFPKAVPSAVLKAGRGRLDGDAAAQLGEASDSFFGGAQGHDAQQVLSAASVLAAHLSEQQTSQLATFGRVIWEATGGSPDLFPINTELASANDEALRYLITDGPVQSPTFWRDIGATVSLERLLALRIPSGNGLEAFVRANADRLLARHLIVKADQPYLTYQGPSWGTISGALVLRGADFNAYLIPRRDDADISPDMADALEIEDFRSRVEGARVETVSIRTADSKSLKIESVDGFDPQTDKTFGALGQEAGARIVEVGLLLEGKRLQCDFIGRSASGVTNALFSVVGLIGRALPLLYPVRDPLDLEEVNALSQAGQGLNGPDELFPLA